MMEGIKEESVGYLFNVEVTVEQDAAPDGRFGLGRCDQRRRAGPAHRRGGRAAPSASAAPPKLVAKGLGANRPRTLEYSAPSADADGEVERHVEKESGGDVVVDPNASRAERRRQQREARRKRPEPAGTAAVRRGRGRSRASGRRRPRAAGRTPGRGGRRRRRRTPRRPRREGSVTCTERTVGRRPAARSRGWATSPPRVDAQPQVVVDVGRRPAHELASAAGRGRAPRRSPGRAARPRAPARAAPREGSVPARSRHRRPADRG